MKTNEKYLSNSSHTRLPTFELIVIKSEGIFIYFEFTPGRNQFLFLFRPGPMLEQEQAAALYLDLVISTDTYTFISLRYFASVSGGT